jgi:DNA-binding MarR family transcriptional regulator
LAAATAAVSVEYYRQLRKAQVEYEKAKGIVGEIVLSFDRELKRESERLDLLSLKFEGDFGKADASLKKVETLEKQLAPIENQISTISHGVNQASNSILSGLTGLESKVKDIEAAQETIKLKIASFEDQIQKFSITPELKNEPVIPIKRDKAMAVLTDTEIQVLEMLSSEGSKTAPEIKERVHLSREHTARLMKKLYEDGYLEREVDKIPFRYSIKAEMQKLLRKPESAQTT